MKSSRILMLFLIAAASPLVQASESKRTADYFLTTPADFEGKDVTLDVAFVKPMHRKSPAAELAFFHVMTINRIDYKPGGMIVVAIASDDAAKFAKKFGTDFQGRTSSHSLTGTLTAIGGNGPDHQGGKIWIVDTTGKAAALLKDKKLEGFEGDGMDGGGPGPHRFGPKGRGPGPFQPGQ